MPSNNKRKHHAHSSNGDLPPTSSADNRHDLIANEELVNRHLLANGKENLLHETVPVARASNKGTLNGTLSHCDILARTSSDGGALENSCVAETSEKHMNTNGKNRPLCSSPSCAHRQNGRTDAIANLKQLNKHLLEQVCSLRSEDSVLCEKLKSLQIQLEQNAARGDVLFAEKNLLENQKLKFELDLKASTQKLAKLGLENIGLLEAKEILLVANHDLQKGISESEEKLQEMNEKLKVSIDAMAMAEQKVQFLEAEMELVLSERKNLNENILLLQKQNSDLHSALKDLQLEKDCLEDELGSFQNTSVNVEEQIMQVGSVKEALETKLASRSLQRRGFQMQLEGAWQQIRSLEAQQEASMAERFDLEKQIKQLENALIAARDECEETFCMLELERDEKLCLRTTLGKSERMSEALQNEFDTMTISTANLQMSADYSQQQIVSLEAKMECLLKERVALERTKASLKENLQQLKVCSDEAFESSKQEIGILKEKVCKLEKALASADKQALEDGRCMRVLNSEIKELSTCLKQRKRLADMSLSLAAASTGLLVVLGIMFIMKREK